jgi:hypothetical protein
LLLLLYWEENISALHARKQRTYGEIYIKARRRKLHTRFEHRKIEAPAAQSNGLVSPKEPRGTPTSDQFVLFSVPHGAALALAFRPPLILFICNNNFCFFE